MSLPSRDARFVLCLAPLLGATLYVALAGPIERAPFELSLALGVAGVAWLAAVRLAAVPAVDAPRARASRAGPSLAVVVAGAVALRMLALAHDPGLSDDVYRTVWEGSVVLEGVSPYAYAPDAPELAELRARLPRLFAALNNPGISAAYPPVTQAVGAGTVFVARALGREGLAAVELVRVCFGACDLLVLWPLVALLRRARLPDGLAVVWGWSPLVTFEFAGAGHFDSLGILLLCAALASLPHAPSGPATSAGEGRGALAWGAGLVLLAGAILVKYLPLCALPFAARGRGPVAGTARLLLVLALCLAGFLPLTLFEGGLRGLDGGLSEYGLRWESTSLVYRWIEPAFAAAFERDGTWTDPRRLGRMTIGLAWLACGALAWRRRAAPVAATGTLIAAFLVLSPTLHPWYLTWVVPFLALRAPSLARSAWLLLVAAAPLFYLTLVRWRTEGVWEEPAWLWPAIALPFLVLLAAGSLVDRVSSRA